MWCLIQPELCGKSCIHEKGNNCHSEPQMRRMRENRCTSDGDINQWEEMIDTNVKGLLYVSRAILPGMIVRKKGSIVNIASIAGRETYPLGNVYCATKSAARTLSEAMRIDVNGSGIRVMNVDPGMVETEFSIVRFKGDEKKADAVYDGYDALQAKDIADIIHYVAHLPAHVCINDLVVTCLSQANSFYLHK